MPTFHHAGLTFDYLDEGTGEPVVLLHGFPEDATSWRRVAPLLHAGGLRTLAPNQRGYSPGAVPDRRRDYRIGLLSADVLALLDAAGIEQAHVVGHDWGGAVAWDLGMRHSDRVKSLVILSTPHPSAMLWSLPRSAQALRSTYMVAFQMPRLPERFMAREMERGLRSGGLNASDARRYAEKYADPAGLTGPLNWYRAIPFGTRPTAVRVPTTYVWGRRDLYLGAAAAHKTGDFVRADYRFVDLDATHWLPEDAADAVADTILDRVRSVNA